MSEDNGLPWISVDIKYSCHYQPLSTVSTTQSMIQTAGIQQTNCSSSLLSASTFSSPSSLNSSASGARSASWNLQISENKLLHAIYSQADSIYSIYLQIYSAKICKLCSAMFHLQTTSLHLMQLQVHGICLLEQGEVTQAYKVNGYGWLVLADEKVGQTSKVDGRLVNGSFMVDE